MAADRVNGTPGTGRLAPLRRTQGTAPLDEAQLPPAPPPAPRRGTARDLNGVVARPGSLAGEVALDAVVVPSAPPPPPKPREKKGFWDRLGDAAGNVLDKVGDAAKATLDKVGDGAELAADGLGDLLGDALEALGADGAAKATRKGAQAVGRVANQVLDAGGEVANLGLDAAGAAVGDPVAFGNRLADQFLGPEVYPGQVGGLVGAVSNRLEPGEGAFLTGTAKVTLPTQTVAAIFSLGAGAVVPNLEGEFQAGAEMSRGPNGKLRVALTIKASQAAVWETGIGAKLKGRIGGTELGFEAGLKAEGEISASQSMKVNLEFDPNKPEDVARMRALLEPKAADLVNPLSFTLNHGKALQEALANNRTSVEVGADFGAKGALKGSASVGKLGEDGTGIDGASLGAKLGLKASGKVGTTVETMRDGGRKLTFTASAGGELDLRVPVGFSTRDGVRGAGRFSIETGPDGKLRDVAVQLAEGVDLGAGKMSGTETRNLITGRHSTQRAVIVKLNEEGLSKAQAMIDGGMLAVEAFAQLAKDPKMVTHQLRTIEADAFGLGVEGSLSMGVGRVDLSLMVEAGRTMVRSEDLKPLDLNESNELIYGAQNNRR